MSSEFTFGDNSDKSSIFFEKKMNLADHDFTEHQITQILTLSQLHATPGADRGNPTVHTYTQHVDWSRQRESDCLIKQVIFRLLSSVQCSAYPICVSPWNDP